MRQILNFLPYYLFYISRLPWVLLVAPLSFNGRQIIRQAAVKAGFDRGHLGVKTAKDYPLPVKAIDAVVKLDTDVQLIQPNGYDGSVSTYELLILNSLVKHHNPSQMVEFGTFDGRTAFNFISNAPKAKLTTIDYDQKPHVFDGSPLAKNVTKYSGDSTKFDTGPLAGKAQFIFVDGGHDEDIATSDSLKAMEMVAAGGVVVWHDYKWFKGVQTALDVCMAKYGKKGFTFIEDTSMVMYQAPKK